MASKSLNPEAPSFFPFYKSIILSPPPVYFTIYETYPITTHFPPPTNLLHNHHDPPPPVVSLPPPPPPLKKLIQQSLIPVPSGPKLPRNGFHRFSRGDGGGQKVFLRVDRERNTPEKIPTNATSTIVNSSNCHKSCVSHKGFRCTRNLKKNVHHEILPLNPVVQATTVMIRNIPNKYTRKLLLEFLDNHCKLENEKAKEEKSKVDINVVSAYDFLYLPIDFCHRLNAGYAFVNFTNAKAVWRFHNAFDGKSWEMFQSPKRIHITQARIQGREALITHFERRPLCCDSEEYLPASFDPARDGSGKYCKTKTIGKYW